MTDSSEAAVTAGLRQDLVDAMREMTDEALKALANTAINILMERGVAALHPDGTDTEGMWSCPVDGCGIRIHIPTDPGRAQKALTVIENHKARHEPERDDDA